MRPARTALLIALFLFGTTELRAQKNEYGVKSLFLLNFTQFVEWPSAAFSRKGAPFVIGVAGNDPFGPYLDEMMKSKRVKGHPIVVRRFASLQEARSCHLLFVCNNIRSLSGLPAHSLLTVGEAPDFNKAGGMIQFYSEKDRVRFQVRPALVRAARLSISSKLLRLAKIVE